MTISNTFSVAGSSCVSLSIEDFRREAAVGNDLCLQIDGESFKLVASGQMPSGRTVAWVEGGDATGMFVAAMNEAFGARLSQAVANELGLQPTPGKPLSSRTVAQAISMAETANTVLDGVSFAEKLGSKKA